MKKSIYQSPSIKFYSLGICDELKQTKNQSFIKKSGEQGVASNYEE